MPAASLKFCRLPVFRSWLFVSGSDCVNAITRVAVHSNDMAVWRHEIGNGAFGTYIFPNIYHASWTRMYIINDN